MKHSKVHKLSQTAQLVRTSE